MEKCLIEHRVEAMEIIELYTIKITFEDDTVRTIDFSTVLDVPMYKPMKDPQFFNRVYISDGIKTLTWPHGADFNPDHLYNWEEHESGYIAMAERAKKTSEKYRRSNTVQAGQ
jgi:hypothetical protein